jgi:hypothetical protein
MAPMQAAITAEPLWIGSGGSASSGTQQLNMNVGGNDTVGCSTPAGADCSAANASQFTSGFFASQTY